MSIWPVDKKKKKSPLSFFFLQAREKEERLLRRQINRERLEEKRKQKAAEKTKSLKTGSQDAKGVKIATTAFVFKTNKVKS